MPRGQSKQSPILSSVLGGALAAVGRARPLLERADPDHQRAGIERCVSQFADAWFRGDSAAMVHSLHPDYVHRLVAIDGRGEPSGALLRSAVGVQGQFGSLTPPERRRREVRILDVRHNSASAVAVMGDWILQIHLARLGGQWAIVNAMWEMESQ